MAPVQGRSHRSGARAPSASSYASAAPCRTTETKASFKTTEFFAFLAAVAGVLLAGLVVDDATNGGFDAKQVWLYVTILTVGYRAARVVRRVRRLGGRDPRDGALSYAAGAAAAAGAFQVLRHTAGRLVGAVIDH